MQEYAFHIRQLNILPTARLFRRSMCIAAHMGLDELSRDVLLYATLEECHNVLPALLNRQDIEAKQVLEEFALVAGIPRLCEEDIVWRSQAKPSPSLFLRRMTEIPAHCLFPDQTAIGPLHVLRDLVGECTGSEVNLRFSVDKCILLRTIEESQEFHVEAHLPMPAPMPDDKLNALVPLLSSKYAMVRFMAGMSLLHEGRHLSTVRRSFEEMLTSDGTNGFLDFSTVSGVELPSFHELLRRVVRERLM